MSWQIRQGDVTERLCEMPDRSVQTCITSPPYFGLRDYGDEGQIGLEPTPDAYVAKLVEVFADVKRVLRDDGTLWLNLGDSYAANGGHTREGTTSQRVGRLSLKQQNRGTTACPPGFKPKDLLGIPWMVAFALRADGWYLRSEVIWAKSNPMPESVTDRPTKAHEQVFLLSKSVTYFYDQAAILEPHAGPLHAPGNNHAESWREVRGAHAAKGMSGHLAEPDRTWGNEAGRNRRSVWTVATAPYPEAHFATFPPKLIEPMVLAGAPREGVVLDPFAGSGTTLQVAIANGRQAIGVELNADYCALARQRLEGVTPSMFDVEAA